MVECARYHSNKRNIECQKINSYLGDMLMRKGPHELPFIEGNMFLTVDQKGELYSQLLTSAPLVVHLDLQNYKITLETAEVCPQLIQIVSYQGCYACATMAMIRFRALSTCLPGTSSVAFQKISQYTPGIVLLQTEVEYAIQISTEYKCVTDQLCLTAGKHRSCEAVEFCLDKPVIKLYQGNITSVQGQANYAPTPGLGGFGDWLSKAFSFSCLGTGTIFAVVGVVANFPIVACCVTLFKMQ